MSYKATAWAYDMPLRGPAKPVLVALADFADEAGSCYPGQDRLCQMTGLSIRTVRRALERLEELALIAREHRYDTRGHRTSDRYVLALDSQSLPVTVTAGQSDLRSESPRLPVTLTAPTGQSDRVTVRRTIREPSGGPHAAEPTPEAVDNSNPPVPWCRRHAATEGSERPCAACERARLAWAADLLTPTRQPPPAAPKEIRRIAGLCDAHRQPAATCEACAYERREGISA